MCSPLSSLKFFNGETSFTALEHLQERDNILVKDGDSYIAIKRNKTLGRLMKNVDEFPVICESTYEIRYQRTMTLFYRTIENPDEMKQITFPYDPSVFNNYSIFHFIQMGSFPHEDGTVYHVGDLRCYTVGSWSVSSCLKSLTMGIVPQPDEAPPASPFPHSIEVYMVERPERQPEERPEGQITPRIPSPIKIPPF
jgi:hypothetical protein